ncbi:MAG: carbamoyl-phosphate synthase (glutamine-hydrolyzing) large subunit [Nitrososphaeria archaeon]|jgi:carbamoyl-phosphate synthase large subunit
MAKFDFVKKVLVIGSGPIQISMAGEFDYSGTQALKALKEESIETILVNSNIATIQTDPKMADRVYLIPTTPEFVEKVIEKERPDGVLLGFGGQTALNCGFELYRRGIFEKYKTRVFGTSVESINITSDRQLFRKTMEDNNLPVLASEAVTNVKDALKIADRIGYPVIIRVAYNLGGRGGGVAYNQLELDEIVSKGIANSYIGQVLIEEYIGPYKQVEYEVVRDYDDNAITVCNMENVLGMRVHTGDNFVVSPSQTLTNDEYHLLREACIKATRASKIVGECNVQLALDPKSNKFYIIEINPRLSRSSALASKATGYPLAYIAAKLAIGYSLPEITNKVTNATSSFFEPALDYVVIKVPRWDLSKFGYVDRKLRTQMKSVGEVMAIGRTFEEALQKAMRMLDIGLIGLHAELEGESVEDIENALSMPTDSILLTIVKALKIGISVDKICKLTWIDRWFVDKIKNIVDIEQKFKNLGKLEGNADLVRVAKKMGFSDNQIAKSTNTSEKEVRSFRKEFGIIPVVKQVDTLAAEWPAKTNYLYLTYGGNKDDIDFKDEKKKVIVLGAGTYRIGSSVEFDWSTMNLVWSLKKFGINETIVVNCNPETVSTDYDMSDKLYFEEISFERVADIYEKENPIGVVTCVGGQTANNLAPKLSDANIKILGTTGENVDRAEDRVKFSSMLDSLDIHQPKWAKFSSIQEAKRFAEDIEYPVIVRPSYVLGGAVMKVAWNHYQLEEFLKKAAKVTREFPVTVSKFVSGAMEVEVDGISDGNNVLIGAVIEHLEQAGIHSGDATMVIPSQRLSSFHLKRIKDYSRNIARALKIVGPFNVQYLVKGYDVSVIECNLRASRSMPFVSKIKGINLMDYAAKALLNMGIEDMDDVSVPYVGVKAPQFSFMQIDGADPILGVEMKSTGEAACIGDTFYEALVKASIAVGLKIPTLSSKGSIFVSAGTDMKKAEIEPLIRRLLWLGCDVYCTPGTAAYFKDKGLKVNVLNKVSDKKEPNILSYLVNRKIDLVINIPEPKNVEEYESVMEDEYVIRRKAVEMGIQVVTVPKVLEELLKGISSVKELKVKSLQEYYQSL